MTNPQRSFREASVAGYDGFFADVVARLHVERRYRIFGDLKRMAGRFPHALWHSPYVALSARTEGFSYAAE
jgi:5-aminolevulinate synthase